MYFSLIKICLLLCRINRDSAFFVLVSRFDFGFAIDWRRVLTE